MGTRAKSGSATIGGLISVNILKRGVNDMIAVLFTTCGETALPQMGEVGIYLGAL